MSSDSTFLTFDIFYHSTFFPIGLSYFRHYFYSAFCPIRHYVPFGLSYFRHYVFSVFCPIRHFSVRHFLPFDILSFGILSHSTFCRSTFFTFGVCYFDIFSVNRSISPTGVLKVLKISAIKSDPQGAEIWQEPDPYGNFGSGSWSRTTRILYIKFWLTREPQRPT